MAWLWYRVLKCDRCGKEIPDTAIYSKLYEGVILNKIFCKDCIDRLKKLLDEFWNPYTREKIGDADMYKYALPKGYPLNERVITTPKFNLIDKVTKPKHEGRKPTNIFSKLFYMMFFEKVE